MHVITGLAKGKKITTIEGTEVVRPTPERVKEGIFSAIQFEIEGRSFLDLFAGSGQLGIEALSRGAEFAVFSDENPEAIKHITKNVESTGFLEKSKIIKGDYLYALSLLNTKFDFIFLDPPYSSGLLIKSLENIFPYLKDTGTVLCEHPFNQEMPQKIAGLVFKKMYKYGKVCVTTYNKEGVEN